MLRPICQRYDSALKTHEWSGPGGIQALSERPSGFLQCFDTVG